MDLRIYCVSIWFLAPLTLVSGLTMSSECPGLKWSNNPGAYEAQLMRRCNNPYFPESYRVVSGEELSEARKIDNEDYILVEQDFAKLASEIESLPPTLTIGELHKIRERIDSLILFSMGVGGLAYVIASKADQVREALISDMRAAFPNDEELLSSIEKADNFHKENVRKFHIPVMAQMLRERSAVKEEHTIATILSEDPDTIALVFGVMSEDVRAVVELEALRMMKEALNGGYIDPQFEEKISALDSSR